MDSKQSYIIKYSRSYSRCNNIYFIIRRWKPRSHTRSKGQGIAILNNQIAINGVTKFNNSINVNNNTITLTDGTITNTLNKSDWTGTIKTFNTTANATHFLNFSDGSGTGQGNPQKIHY